MKTAVVVNNQYMGSGSDELGEKLIGSFLRKLWSMDNKPSRIIFYNSAVKLLSEGSPVLDALDGLYEIGVDLIACGTCITFYDLKDKIKIGRISDMSEIVNSMFEMDKVITI